MEKRAILSSLAMAMGVHVAQNKIAERDIKSPKFKNEASTHLLNGVMNRESDTSTGKLKRVVKGVYSPESVMIHNGLYEKGNSIRSHLAKKGIIPEGLSKRQIVSIRKGLKNSGIGPLEDLGRNITADSIKTTLTHPIGHKKPYSKLGIAAGNLVASAAEPSAGIINAVKYGLESKAVSNTKLGRKVNEAMVNTPIKDAFNKGKAGISINKTTNSLYKTFINGPAGHIMSEANKAGSKISKSSYGRAILKALKV